MRTTAIKRLCLLALVCALPCFAQQQINLATQVKGILPMTSLSGTTVQFNTALSDNDFCTLAGSEALTNKTYNGHTFTAGSSTFTGTAAQTYTFPTTTATLARTDAAQSFTGLQTFSTGITSTAASNSFGATVIGNVTYTGGSDIYESATNGPNAINFNYVGYAGGATQYRSLNIYDGKTNLIAGVSSTGLAVTGELSATGAITASTGLNGIVVDAGAGVSKRANLILKGTDAGSANNWWYVGPNIAASDGSFQLYAGNGAGVRLNITSAGATTISNLAGTGSRAVLADANGLLSAPVSDERLKENFRPLGYGMSEILQMADIFKEAGRFNFIDKQRFGAQDYLGASAQRVAKILPEVAGQMVDGTWYLTEEKYGPLLFVGIADHEARIKTLEAENAELKARLAKVEAAIEKLTQGAASGSTEWLGPCIKLNCVSVTVPTRVANDPQFLIQANGSQ